MLAVQRRSLLNQPLDTVGLEFTRLGVAYDHMGRPVGSNVPRFEHRVPDITVSNILTGNQSDCGDTLNPELLTLNQRTGTSTLGDTTGFTALGTVPATISSSTEQAHSGNRSLKVVTSGNGALEGVRINTTAVVTSTGYIYGIWVNAPLNATLVAQSYDNSGGSTLGEKSFTGTGTWQFVEIPITTVDTTCKLNIRTYSTAQAITFYVDDCRLGTNVTTGYALYGNSTISITGEQTYQGYRCLKIVTDGSTSTGGVQFSGTPIANSITYTPQARIKSPVGVTIRFRMFNSVSGWLPDIATVVGDGTFKLLSGTITTPATGTNNLYIQITTQIATTFYIDQVMVETGSVTHDWAYGGSSYSTYKTEYGCYVGEAVTNGLTANQSTCTDTSGDTTGFSSVNGAVLTSSGEQFLQGSKSLKVVTSGDIITEGVSISKTGLTIGTTYTFQGRVYMPVGSVGRMVFSNATYITGNGNWQFVSVTFTATGTSHTLYFTTYTQQAITFHMDLFQFTATAYPLPQDWTLGGTTKQAETLTAPANSLNIDTSGANPNQGSGTIEIEVYKTQGLADTTASSHRIFYTTGTGTTQIITIRNTAGNLGIGLMRAAGENSIVTTPIISLSQNWHRVGVAYDSTILKFFIDGASVGTPISNPYQPVLRGERIYIGTDATGNQSGNGIYRNLIITRPKREDTDITSRASLPSGQAPRPDRGTMLYAPLMYDLKAYRVRA